MKQTATKTDQDVIDIFNGYMVGNNSLTQEQVKKLFAFYGYEPIDFKKLNITTPLRKTKYHIPNNDPEVLLTAGAFRNLTRDITHDGIRVMAFLSKYLEKGEDPVKMVATALTNAGYDVDDEFWDEETEDEENT